MTKMSIQKVPASFDELDWEIDVPVATHPIMLVNIAKVTVIAASLMGGLLAFLLAITGDFSAIWPLMVMLAACSAGLFLLLIVVALLFFRNRMHMRFRVDATGAGALAARWVIHAVSIDNARRTDSATIDRAVRNAFARARELGVETLAIPALGTGVGGFPIAEGARVTVAAIRSELARSPRLTRVTLALRGAASYEAFRLALAAAAEPPAGISA